MSNFSICIPTYKRPHLLKRLICDILEQTSQPDNIIVVDGDPISGEVKQSLLDLKPSLHCRIEYIPSNHANLPYQRYLGWRVAKELDIDILIYLDDDQRIDDPDAIKKIGFPFTWTDRKIVGVTANSQEGNSSIITNEKALLDRANSHRSKLNILARYFGSGKKILPGGITPTGHRKLPVFQGNDYERVYWLQGRVMAYRMSCLTQACFSDDAFAMANIACGLGEDTFLSCRVGCSGELLFAFNAVFKHPNDDLPNSYPIKSYRLGYATSYSRRLLNENFRGFDQYFFIDRLELFKSYLGVSILNWLRVLPNPFSHRTAFAWGYTLGAIRGIFQKPRARSLTPNINWWQDAEEALNKRVNL